MQNLSGSEQQNLLYLVVLLVFLLSMVFFRRDFKLLQILKYLGLWGLIALVFVALYSYRFEFVDLKNRVLGELNPSVAQIDQKGRIVLNIARDGHFYLDTRVNGASVRFMIDTGASDMVLNSKDARRAGVDFKRLVFNKRYQTANGEVFGANTILNRVEVAKGRVFYDVEASVNSADLGVSLLGMRFLRRFERYEFTKGRLVLE